jgi:hypothetical protein
MFDPNGKDTAKGDVLPSSNRLRHRFAPADGQPREGGEDAENAGAEGRGGGAQLMAGENPAEDEIGRGGLSHDDPPRQSGQGLRVRSLGRRGRVNRRPCAAPRPAVFAHIAHISTSW